MQRHQRIIRHYLFSKIIYKPIFIHWYDDYYYTQYAVNWERGKIYKYRFACLCSSGKSIVTARFSIWINKGILSSGWNYRCELCAKKIKSICK